MSSAFIARLGIIFLGTGVCATFLMYWLWGFPFDKETRTSAAPKALMYTHRILGYIFAITYVAIMWHMLPRMWEYQVEFPARTVAHILLGLTIGFLLVIKISIMRFFRHFEEWMPYLGTALLLCTVLLLGLSVPFVFRESALAAAAPGGSVYSDQSIARVKRLLPLAELPEYAPIDQLASADALADGREILLGHCVKCHDLRTVLLKPRTPANWHSTVVRMAEKPALFAPIDEDQQWRVTAYLIAITPDLQRSAKALRKREMKLEKVEKLSEELSIEPTHHPVGPGPGEGTEEAVTPGTEEAVTPGTEEAMTPDIAAPDDPAGAEETFEDQCSQCHELSDVDADPPERLEDIDELVERMIENGMELEATELELIKWYLYEHYVKKATVQ